MSGWGLEIRAVAEETPVPVEGHEQMEDAPSLQAIGERVELDELVAHDFPAAATPEEEGDEDLETWREDLWLYRNRTQTMLRRYLRFSLEAARVPSIMSREFFKTGVSTYTVGTFEDRVIFVCDMEDCLERLDKFSRELVARVILQEHHPEDIRGGYGLPRRSIYRRVEEALDELSAILLERGLLDCVSEGKSS